MPFANSDEVAFFPTQVFSCWYLIVLVSSDQNEIMTTIVDQIKTCGLVVVLLCCFFRCTETENGDTMSVHVGIG